MTLDEQQYWKIPRGDVGIKELLPRVGYDLKSDKIFKDNLEIAHFDENQIIFALGSIGNSLDDYKKIIEAAIALRDFLKVNNQEYKIMPSESDVSRILKEKAQELNTLADRIVKLEKKVKK